MTASPRRARARLLSPAELETLPEPFDPGTAFYAGYNEDVNRNGFNPFTGQSEPGFRRNGRVFFVKLSYLIRRSF